MATRTDPKLIWRPLSEHNRQSGITPRQWIVHTAVDGPGPTNLGNYFETQTSLESHTWLRWDRHEQLMDFDRQADANYKANRFLKGGIFYGAISTETEDDGTPVQRPWNVYQLNELVRFGVWLSRTYGIPARLCRSWDDTGMGWHAMFPMVWSNQRGKTCPGETRIRQFTTLVLPRIQAELNGGEFTVAEAAKILETVEHIDRLAQWQYDETLSDERKPKFLKNMDNGDRLERVEDKVDALIEALAPDVAKELPPRPRG